ncbi:MAG TPA: cobyrinate a,c-diamide synthase [Methanocorpusculum sp.]|nr:cobyrinate a,c-diamide synthase [Methanocorpusculum sp.]
MKAFLLAANRSGAGKTSITLALAAYFSRTSKVQTFKCATDYIDTSYHAGVTGRPCYNLDSFVQSPEDINDLFSYGCSDADYAIVEGVRGLFEGIDAVSDCGSTASIAKRLNLPVILVVDARSITRSAAALVLGFQHFDPDVRIAGVILNNIGHGSHEAKAREAIEHYCHIPVLGAIPRSDIMELSSRYLGLVPFREAATADEFSRKLSEITEFVISHIDIETLLSVCDDRAVLPDAGRLQPSPECGKTIAIASDEAFCFYYGELVPVLRSCGYRVITFSPLRDELPAACGYIFGGGYPELFARNLSANTRMLEQIRNVADAGVPIYAECGGLLYLMDSIRVREGWHGAETDATYRMCGVFKGTAEIPVRKRLGYVEGTATLHGRTFPLKGHEFHYSSVSLAQEYAFSYSLRRGYGIADGRDGVRYRNVLASYTHLMPITVVEFLKELFEK